MSEAAPANISYLQWMYQSLGVPYVFLLPLVGLICFILTLIIVLRGKGAMSVAALVLVVHAPLMLGIFAGIQGMIASYQIVAMSQATPQPAQLAEGTSTALFAPMVGMALVAPSYAMAAIGAIIRSFTGNADPKGLKG